MTERYDFIIPLSPSHFIEGKRFERIVLDRISAIVSPTSTASALLFPGQIDYARWKLSIQYSIEYCPWLIGALCGNYDDASVIPRPIDEFTPPRQLISPSSDGSNSSPTTTTIIDDKDLSAGYLISEYYNQDTVAYDATKPIIEYLPKNVHQKMIRVDLAIGHIDGLPVSAFRVTQYQDHFIIGYRLNHAFFDQSAIVSYFAFLSLIYNSSFPFVPLAGSPLPVFKPRGHIVPKDAFFATFEDFVAATPKGYTHELMQSMDFGVSETVSMILQTNKINQLRKDTKSKISTNDLLHAIFLKALARHVLAGGEDKEKEANASIRLFFARNMRIPLYLGKEVIGDYVRVQCFPTTPAKVESETLVALAEENRRLLTSLSDEAIRERYSKECQWFLQYCAHSKENFGLPNCDFVMDPKSIVVTNWSSFPYEEVIFGNRKAAPIELLLEGTPFMARTGAFVRISFRVIEGERQLIVAFTSRISALLDQIRRLAEETELFTCN